MTYNVLVDRTAILEEEVTHLLTFFFCTDVSTTLAESCENSILISFVIDNALLTGADDTIVVRTTIDNLFCSIFKVDIAVEDNLYVTGTYTIRGLTARVGALNHSHTTGSNYYVYSTHKLLSHFDAGLFNYLYHTFGYIERFDSFEDEINGMLRAFLRTGVRRDNDGVASLQCKDDVTHRSNDRVGSRSNSTNYTHRLGNLNHTRTFVDIENTY